MVPGPVLASFWMTPFSLPRGEKSRNLRYLQRIQHENGAPGGLLSSSQQRTPCTSPQAEPFQKCPLCLPANRGMSLQHRSNSHLKRNRPCPPAPPFHPDREPLPFCTPKLSFLPLAYSHLLSPSLSQPGHYAVPSMAAGTRWELYQCLLHGRGLSRDEQ